MKVIFYRRQKERSIMNKMQETRIGSATVAISPLRVRKLNGECRIVIDERVFQLRRSQRGSSFATAVSQNTSARRVM